MKKKICILLCDYFQKEARQIFQSDSFKNEDITLETFPAACGMPPIQKTLLTEIAKNKGPFDSVHVFGSSCLTDLTTTQTDDSNFAAEKRRENVIVHRLEQCFFLCAGKEMVERYLRDGAYLLTSGWLLHWKKRMEQMGFDAESAKEFYRESCTKLVLLDTGVAEDSFKLLQEFADFVDRPFSVAPIGLDYFRLFLENILLQEKLENINIESSSAIDSVQKEKSNFAMALDLLSKLTQTDSEHEIIVKLMELFVMLFAPRIVFYLPVTGGVPGKLRSLPQTMTPEEKETVIRELKQFHEKYAWTESGTGFLLSVSFQENRVGIIKIDSVAFPEYKNHYLNLASYISDVCGLALSNARSYQEKKQAEGRLATQVLEMFYQPDEKMDRIRNILRLIKGYSDLEVISIRLKESEGHPCFTTTDDPPGTLENNACPCEYSLAEDRNCTAADACNCMCENIISRQYDPSRPYFTERGSFWTNDLKDQLADSSSDLHHHFKHRDCDITGYQSVALIPLRTETHFIGLLQLVDSRLDMFTPALISFLEVIGASIATAFHRKKLQDQLNQAQKMDAVGQLAGGVAHDFNNLLTVIKGYCDLALLDVEPKDALYNFLKEIEQASVKAEAFTRQLLIFSRKQSVTPKLLNFNSIISGMEEMLRSLFGEAVEFIIDLTINLNYIKADPGQMEQVLMNMAVNSKDAMPKGGKMTISSHNVLLREPVFWEDLKIEPGEYVMINISDSGVGMSRELQTRIFEPFFSTKKEGRGTGLGLSTVYGIIKQCGGFLEIKSQPGKGSSFKLYFPAMTEETEITLKEKEKRLPLEGKETILVVEDDKPVREMVCKTLLKHGYSVLEAEDGQTALDFSLKHGRNIHLVLTDVVMPGMSGPQLIERLLEFLPDLKIVYMSGHSIDAKFRHGIVDGEVAFIQKPFTSMVLLNKIRRALN
jgi:signal transduction histidine kinase